MAEMDPDSLYSGVKTILAPMVRASTLAMRLEAIDYGCDLVYTEETIARKLLECRRVVNPHFPAVVEYYSDREGTSAFRTMREEKKKLVFQLGVAEACVAQEAALKVCSDVSGVDINMGCPKSFSVKGGMGAALLQKPDVAADILKSIRRVLPVDVAVSCKIRFLDPTDIQRTADFVQLCHRSGAEAVAVHMRTTPERPSAPARWDQFKELRARCPNIFMIANGDLLSRTQLATFCERVGADACMIARGAQYNPAIFSKEGTAPPQDEVIRRYVRRSIAVGATYQTAKWNLATMVSNAPSQVFGGCAKAWNNRLTSAKSMAQIAALAEVPYDFSAFPHNCHSVTYFKTTFRAAVDDMPDEAEPPPTAEEKVKHTVAVCESAAPAPAPVRNAANGAVVNGAVAQGAVVNGAVVNGAVAKAPWAPGESAAVDEPPAKKVRLGAPAPEAVAGVSAEGREEEGAGLQCGVDPRGGGAGVGEPPQKRVRVAT